MFRITQYMKELLEPTPIGPKRNPPGPVVIWNLIRRCNLKCKHCYSISSDHNFPGELSTKEVFSVMDDLWSFGVRVLILSGGEPLLRPDIFEISRRAKEMGFYAGLSTNGTLIDESNIKDIAAAEYDYVGDQSRRDRRHARCVSRPDGRFRQVVTGGEAVCKA